MFRRRLTDAQRRRAFSERQLEKIKQAYVDGDTDFAGLERELRMYFNPQPGLKNAAPGWLATEKWQTRSAK